MFHVKLEGLGLGPDALRALGRYEAMLHDRAVPLGFVAASDRDRLVERHISDSLRALAVLPTGPAAVADLGSGAGLPGVPIAIARPDLQVSLVESRARKVAFLEWVVDQLALPNARVVSSRVEDVVQRFEACTARALAAPEPTWAMARRLLAPSGILVYFGGESWSEDQAQRLVAQEAVVESVRWDGGERGGPIVVMRQADLE
jgi:16S rRNA (guanine527-N7)-methyltransferase